MNNITEINKKEQDTDVAIFIAQIAQVYNVRVSDAYLESSAGVFENVKVRHPDITIDVLKQGYNKYIEQTNSTFMPTIGAMIDAYYKESMMDCKAETEHFIQAINQAEFGLEGKALCAIFPNQAFYEAYMDLDRPSKYLSERKYFERFADQYYYYLHNPRSSLEPKKLWIIANIDFMEGRPAEAFEDPHFAYMGLVHPDIISVINKCKQEYQAFLLELKQKQAEKEQEESKSENAAPANYDMWEE